MSEHKNSIKKTICAKNLRININALLDARQDEKIINFIHELHLLLGNEDGERQTYSFYIIGDDEIRKRISAELDFSEYRLPQAKDLQTFNSDVFENAECRVNATNDIYVINYYKSLYWIANRKTNQSVIVKKSDNLFFSVAAGVVLCPLVYTGDYNIIHSGLVGDGDRNILVFNGSNKGKTSFELLFHSNGWNILSDDVVYFDMNGNALPLSIRDYLHIRIGTLIKFSDIFSGVDNIIESYKHHTEEQLYEIGKRNQLTISLNSLKGRRDDRGCGTFCITHAMMVEISTNYCGVEVNDLDMDTIINAAMDMSCCSTVSLFSHIANLVSLEPKTRRERLTQAFENTNKYFVTAGIDYRDCFGDILKKLKIDRVP